MITTDDQLDELDEKSRTAPGIDPSLENRTEELETGLDQLQHKSSPGPAPVDPVPPTPAEDLQAPDTSGAQVSLGDPDEAKTGQEVKAALMTTPLPQEPQFTWQDIVKSPLYQKATPEQKESVLTDHAVNVRDFLQSQEGADAGHIDTRVSDFINRTRGEIFAEPPPDLGVAHQVLNAIRVGGADIGGGLFNAVSGISRRLAVNEEEDGLSAAPSKATGFRTPVAPNPKIETFLNDSADYWKQRAAGASAQSLVDPKLEDTGVVKAAHVAAGLGTALGEASIPVVGLPLMLGHNAFQRYGEVFNSTGDKAKAEHAMAISLAGNALFVGQGSGIVGGLNKVLPQGANAIRNWAVKVSASTGGNVLTGQLIKAADAASEAPEGQKMEAFTKAFGDLAPGDAGIAAAFGILSAHGHIDGPKIKAAAEALTADAARAQAMEDAGLPNAARGTREAAQAQFQEALGARLPQAQTQSADALGEKADADLHTALATLPESAAAETRSEEASPSATAIDREATAVNEGATAAPEELHAPGPASPTTKSSQAWQKATYEGVKQALIEKGVDPDSANWTPDAMAKLHATILGNHAKFGQGRDELLDRSRDTIQSDLIKNAQENGNPLVARNAAGQNVPYAASFRMRTVTGNESVKLQREVSGETADLVRDAAATPDGNRGQEGIPTHEQKQSFADKLTSAINQYFSDFVKNNPPPASAPDATPDQVLRASKIVMDDIGREKTGHSIGLADTRGRPNKTVQAMIADPEFRAAVKEQIFGGLTKLVKERTDSSILEKPQNESPDGAELTPEDQASLHTITEAVKGGVALPLATNLLPEHLQQRIRNVVESDGGYEKGSAEVLKRIASLKGGSETQQQKLIANLLLANEDTFHIHADPTLALQGANGRFNPRKNEIAIDPFLDDATRRWTILHEQTHALLFGKTEAYVRGHQHLLTNTDIAALQEIDKLREHALQQADVPEWVRESLKGEGIGSKRFALLRETDPSLSDWYPLTNLHEFMAGVMTDASFQSRLHQMKAPSTANGFVGTLWERVKAAIRELVSGKPSADSSLYARAFDRTLDLVDSGVLEDQLTSRFGDSFDFQRHTDAHQRFMDEFAKSHGHASADELATENPSLYAEGSSLFRSASPEQIYGEEHLASLSDASRDPDVQRKTSERLKPLFERIDAVRKRALPADDPLLGRSIEDRLGEVLAGGHPTDDRIESTLREVGGLTDEQISASTQAIESHMAHQAAEKAVTLTSEKIAQRGERAAGLRGVLENAFRATASNHLAAVPGLGSVLKKVNDLRAELGTLWRTTPARDRVAATADAVDTQARIAGQQVGNKVRLSLNSNGKDLEAMTPVVEATGSREKMAADAKLVLDSDKAAPALKAIYKRALSDFDRLNAKAGLVNSIHEAQLKDEHDSGIKTDEVEGYVAHRYDMDLMLGAGKPLILDAGGGSGSSSNFFKKQRVFSSYAEAIAQGYIPKTLDISKLVDNRVVAGQRLVNQRAWVESLRGIKSPSDGLPLVTDLKTQEKGTQVAPTGYRAMMPIPGVTVAVKDEFARLLGALTGESHVPKLLSKVEGTIKHGTLLFDSFHAFRIMYKQLFQSGDISYGKGKALLEYSDGDLDKAVKANEIAPEAAEYARENRPLAQKLISAGLNVGQVQDALYKDVVSGIPVIGTFNKWVFDKLTRGAMIENAVWNLKRNQKLFPELSAQEVVRRSAKEMNQYFGNLRSQGLFKSKTWQDMSRLVFLAPQWLEGMATTEAKGYGQLARAPYDAATGKGVRVGSIGKSIATGILASAAANQIINLMTTGHPTWENPEDHKWDAFIPDWISGFQGYYFSPFSVAAELTHDFIRYHDRGESPTDTTLHIASNKLSPLSHAFRDIALNKDFFGRPLGGLWERVKQAAVDLAPVPLPARAALNDYKGSAQRQLIGSLGLKVDPVPSAKDRARLRKRLVEQRHNHR